MMIFRSPSACALLDVLSLCCGAVAFVVTVFFVVCAPDLQAGPPPDHGSTIMGPGR